MMNYELKTMNVALKLCIKNFALKMMNSVLKVRLGNSKVLPFMDVPLPPGYTHPTKASLADPSSVAHADRRDQAGA